MKKLITIVSILLVIGVTVFVVNQYTVSDSQIDTPAEPTTEARGSRSNEKGYDFQYPEIATSTYVTMTDWPPRLHVVSEPLECTEAGTPEARAGQTRQKTIGDRAFCITEVVEGAAGSSYHQYAYATQLDNASFIYTFTVQMPQCQNYDAPERNQCLHAQHTFDPDAIAATLAESTRPQFSPNSFRWACPPDYQFQITYQGENNPTALLELPAQGSYELQVVRSGSGARYSNEDESVVFWEHQGESRIEVDNAIVREGCIVESESVRVLQ